MSRAEIIRMAQEAGLDVRLANMGAASVITSEQCDGITMDDLMLFAALVAAAEREACAKLCEAFVGDIGPGPVADAIRARV